MATADAAQAGQVYNGSSVWDRFNSARAATKSLSTRARYQACQPVSIGRIRIEGDTTFQLAFRHRKIAVKNQGDRAKVSMARARVLIVRHRHEGDMLCRVKISNGAR